MKDLGIIVFKKCSVCKKTKEGSEFSPDKRNKKYGLSSRCKECNNDRNKERNARGYIPSATRKAVFERDKCCQICGISEMELKYRGLTWHCDHKLPVVHCKVGKGANPSNLWKLCSDCNTSKSDSILLEVLHTIPHHVLTDIATDWFKEQARSKAFKYKESKISGRLYTEIKLKNKRPKSEKNKNILGDLLGV